MRLALCFSAICCLISHTRIAMAAPMMEISAITDLSVVRVKDGAVADPTPILSQTIWQNVANDAPTLMFVVRRPG